MNGGNMNTSSVGEQFTEIYLKKDSNVQVGLPQIVYAAVLAELLSIQAQG